MNGLLRTSEEDQIYRKHHNAQRLLRPIKVINPFSNELTYPDDKLLMRREHKKYLTLIKAIAFLHQYQRKIKTVKNKSGETLEYIEATLDDIELANRLASEVLGRSLDELSPHTRSLLIEIKRMVDERCKKVGKRQNQIHFTRRELCDYSGWSYWQLHAHLHQLAAMDYLLVNKGGKDNICRYELLWDGKGEDGTKFFPGLIDVKKLKNRKRK